MRLKTFIFYIGSYNFKFQAKSIVEIISYPIFKNSCCFNYYLIVLKKIFIIKCKTNNTKIMIILCSTSLRKDEKRLMQIFHATLDLNTIILPKIVLCLYFRF